MIIEGCGYRQPAVVPKNDFGIPRKIQTPVQRTFGITRKVQTPVRQAFGMVRQGFYRLFCGFGRFSGRMAHANRVWHVWDGLMVSE